MDERSNDGGGTGDGGDRVVMEREPARAPRRGIRFERFFPLDVAVLSYTAWVMLLVALGHVDRLHAIRIVGFHLFVLAAILLIPPRGARWETSPPGERRFWRNVRGGARFFRYSYPLLLILFFFEEVQHTVGAVFPGAPYWFEKTLYAWDRRIFGELPSILLNPFVGTAQDEILHGFYLSYYFLLVGGVVLAWLGEGRSRHPAPGFQTTLTAAILSFFFCFVWYPFLPARGPWENPELMATMTPFRGIVFVPLIQKIIEHGSVSGGCFPSSHVAGSFGVVLALARFRRRPALVLGLFACGMSVACVYTRYHHGVDVLAGLAAAGAGALTARLVERPSQ